MANRSGIRALGALTTCLLAAAIPNTPPATAGRAAPPGGSAAPARSETLPPDLAPFFTPPPDLAGDGGDYRSPLRFDDGRPVRTPADWRRRRAEIRRAWDAILGPWPDLLPDPELVLLERRARDGYRECRVRLPLMPDRTTEGYLLLPAGATGRRPAVLVVYYEPETGIGRSDAPHRDFARQLVRRGFVTLSIGHAPSIYYPSEEAAALQPLSALACAAANAASALARHPLVDPERIGIVGHSYGGKWAMFASCLDERFACAVWSDPGIVFDETRPNVNYWEPWYLGWDPLLRRRRGVPTPENPRTGAYRRLVEAGRDLHELHALMAPRPFLVSGGSEDPPERWRALHHSIAVNRLLGYTGRVGMTNRPTHAPTPESNAQIARFFEHFLGPVEPAPPGSSAGGGGSARRAAATPPTRSTAPGAPGPAR